MEDAGYLTYIDKYCERTHEGLWAEPLNVVTNLAFVIVLFLLFKYFNKHFKGQYLKYWDISLLLFFLFCLSIGSTLWHLFAQRWALMADVIPILLFINVFLLSCFVRVLKFSAWQAALAFVVYQAMNFAVQKQFDINTLNGSIFYVPILLYLAIIMVFTCRMGKSLCQYYVLSVTLFAIALVLRTLDLSACDVFPLGTHFIWHTLISMMIYALTMSLMRSTHNQIK